VTATAPPAEDRAALVRRRLVASQMRLMDHHPFFGSLLLLAPMEVTDAVATAATDGVRLFFNPSFTAPLTSAELDGLVVHELLHCALRHGARRGPRQPELWNIAADIHVNGQVRQMGHLSLPEGAAEDLDLAPLCVEEIYARLLRQRRSRQLGIRDLLEPGSCGSPPVGAGAGTGAAPSAAGGTSIDLDAYWSDAMQRALAAAHMRGPGTVPAGLRRMIGEAHGPQLDWRTALWRHLVRTPDDFRGFDRRHAWQGIYLDALEGDTLVVDALACGGDEILAAGGSGAAVACALRHAVPITLVACRGTRLPDALWNAMVEAVRRADEWRTGIDILAAREVARVVGPDGASIDIHTALRAECAAATELLRRSVI